VPVPDAGDTAVRPRHHAGPLPEERSRSRTRPGARAGASPPARSSAWWAWTVLVAALVLAPGRAPAAAPAETRADVVGVAATGAPGAYVFHVTLRSPDTGCARYADWWEVVRPDGTLAYRRILLHSHPDEQPFTRAGGPVPVAADETVVVRAHLHPGGYGGASMRGSVRDGFGVWHDPPPAVAADLAAAPPRPDGCLF
jgi:hypothetical protein